MCLAIPVRVTECGPDSARGRVGSGETYVDMSTLLLPEPPKVGDYVIVHAGFALRLLDPAEAEESLKLFREMVAQDGMTPTF